jgi:hypothetical protein
VRKHAGEVDHFVEQIEDAALLRTGSPPHDSPPLTVQSNDLFAGDNRFDHQHAMFVAQQGRDFVADRRQRTVLDLDQTIVRHDIDPITTQPSFDLRITSGVAFFQLAMQRRFHRNNSLNASEYGVSEPM